jgi:hypothetical protein
MFNVFVSVTELAAGALPVPFKDKKLPEPVELVEMPIDALPEETEPVSLLYTNSILPFVSYIFTWKEMVFPVAAELHFTFRYCNVNILLPTVPEVKYVTFEPAWIFRLSQSGAITGLGEPPVDRLLVLAALVIAAPNVNQPLVLAERVV